MDRNPAKCQYYQDDNDYSRYYQGIMVDPSYGSISIIATEDSRMTKTRAQLLMRQLS